MDYAGNAVRRSLFKRTDGLSLIEIMMALMILAIGLLAYGKTSSAIMGTNVQSTRESIAITIAQDLIETLKISPVADGMGAADEKVNVEGVVGGPGALYTRTWSVNLHPTIARLYDIHVTVEWHNQGPRSVTLNTRVTQ